MTKDYEKSKRTLIFIYISAVVHLYLLLIVTMTIDPNFLENFFRSKTEKRETIIENIIVETLTESDITPEQGVISDKDNIGASPFQVSERTYNYPNPDQRPREGESEVAYRDIPQDTEEQDLSEEISDLDTARETDAQEEQIVRVRDYGNPAPFLYDPEKPVEVYMDNYGDISLDTVGYEYAEYFLSMSRKISREWERFFPIFQYYQGIIRSGETIVSFQVDGEGNVISPQITKSYGYGVVDRAGLNAIEYSRNFGPLPEGLREQGKINVNFRFVYMARE